MTKHVKSVTSDRAAELKLVRQIPEDDYNRDVEIVATESGLRIDDYITVPWEWIRRASELLGSDIFHTRQQSTPVEHKNSEA